MYARFKRGASPIAITAALSLAVLLAAFAGEIGERFGKAAPSPRQPLAPAEMQEYLPISDSDGNGAPDWQEELQRAGISLAISTTSTSTTPAESDPLADIGYEIATSLLGSYFSLKESGTYTPSQGEQIAGAVAANIRAPLIFTPHTENEFKIDADVSEKNILSYRSHMREALAPLVTEDEPELAIFARFLETNDPHWLSELTRAANRYRSAERNLLTVSVPKSALIYHVRATNAVGSYATTLERFVRFSKDPLAVMALLRTYNEEEREMLAAFDALSQYYVRSIVN